MAAHEAWRFDPAHEACRSDPGYGGEIATLRVGQFAARQQARIALHQLTALGIRRSTIGRWLAGGFLYRQRPGIYAVGSPANTVESALWEAVLYAGPEAMLSHATAAKWLDMIDRWPAVVHVSTPRRRRSLSGICVRPRRTGLTRTVHDAIAVTTIADTLLDLAAAGELTLVRRSFARLDYQRRPHTGIVRQACRRGRAGSASLRAELDR
jgi:predicted transcriptional regulator of viral defense system